MSCNGPQWSQPVNYLPLCRDINSDLSLTFGTVQYSGSRTYIFFFQSSNNGKIVQPFCTFDFKRHGDENRKKKEKVRDEKNPKRKLRRATRNRSRMISIDEIFIIWYVPPLVLSSLFLSLNGMVAGWDIHS